MSDRPTGKQVVTMMLQDEGLVSATITLVPFPKARGAAREAATEWTEQSRADLLMSLQVACRGSGMAPGRVEIRGPLLVVEVPGVLDASQSKVLANWLWNETQLLQAGLASKGAVAMEGPRQLGVGLMPAMSFA